jgi:NADPH2:quinone reductase
MRAINVTTFGGPEVLVPAELDPPVPGPDQLLVRVTAAGVNYADTHRTDGSYRGGVQLPYVPGLEIVGRTDDGRRVLAPLFELGGGGYAEYAVAAAPRAVDVPEGVTDGQALALLVQGLTAWHLVRNSARVLPGETVVVNAAAGGVGSLAVQLAKQAGATVIATASTDAKRDLARALGADVALDNDPAGYAERVLAATDGRGADVVLDSTAGPTMTAGIESLAGFGRLINYGNAGREGQPPVDAKALAARNLSIGGFWLVPAMGDPAGYGEPLAELLDLTAAGTLRPLVGREYPLEDARRAHEELLARRTTGKLVLTP